MLKRFLILVPLFISLLSRVDSALAEKQASRNTCPGVLDSVTEPSPVDLGGLVPAVQELQTVEKKPALDFSTKAKRELAETFDVHLVKTKMEQFFRLLYVIHSNLHSAREKPVELDSAAVRKILTIAGVFTDPEVPNQIIGVRIDRSGDEPRYTVRFASEPTKVPLNHGKGFYVYESGRCQHTQALIFDQQFSFALDMLRKGNLLAKDFKGVDFYGDFGSHGLFDVDIEYVSLRAVEFYKGTKLGKVRVYVSREEFKKNDHNPILRVITRLVGDSSVQPMDW